MSVVLIAIGCVVSGLIIGLVATATAPVGYEDEAGFHFGEEHGSSVPRESTRPLPAVPHLTPKPA